MAGISSRFVPWAVVTLFILYGGLIPFHLTTDPVVVAAHAARVTLNPLISPDTGRRLSLPDVAQNVLLFLPFGLFGAWALERRLDRRSPAATIAWVAGCAVLLSGVVESLQLFTLDRVSSTADLAVDTLGAIIGAGIAYPLRAAWRRSPASSRAPALAALPAFPPFALAAVLVCAAAWQPFDVTLDVGNAIDKWHALRLDVWQGATPGSHMVGALRYVLLALSAALWLREAGVRRAALWAACLGVIAACGLEASEAAIASRMPGIADVLANVIGVLGGAWLARGWPRGRSPIFWAGLLAVAMSLGAALDWSEAAQQSTRLLSRFVDLSLIVLPVGVAIALALRAKSPD